MAPHPHIQCLAPVCTASDQVYIKSACISWLKWSPLRSGVGQLHLLKSHRLDCRCSGQQPKNARQGDMHTECIHLVLFSFSIVEIGNKSPMGVSPSDFAKQVSCSRYYYLIGCSRYTRYFAVIVSCLNTWHGQKYENCFIRYLGCEEIYNYYRRPDLWMTGLKTK